MSRKQKVHNLLNPIVPQKNTIVEQEIKQRYTLKPKTEMQREYLECIDDCTITLSYGSPGTGKTFIALGKGIELLKAGKVKKVILVRPLQECGEKTGYLPGEKHEKIGPHMVAFTELFGSFLAPQEIKDFQASGVLVIETLGFMRGTTFKESYVVLDEAQNCTYGQLKMFLTRIGFRSKLVLAGDITQTDLAEWQFKDGVVPFEEVINRLDGQDDKIGIIEFIEADVVRHGIIRKLCKLL